MASGSRGPWVDTIQLPQLERVYAAKFYCCENCTTCLMCIAQSFVDPLPLDADRRVDVSSASPSSPSWASRRCCEAPPISASC
eukprot:2668834-Pyramimonas_sp.AAC.1